jgi:nitrogen fixation protein FixH
MSPSRLRTWLWERRWPIGLQLIMAMVISANVVLLYLATHADASRPLEDWYERAVNWDETQALQESSRDLGWSVAWSVPMGPEYGPGMPRPVDLAVSDRHGEPVSGLEGAVRAVRPAGTASGDRAEIAELPQSPGTYRCLLRFSAAGLWQLDATLEQEALTWIGSHRLDLRTEQGAL